MPSICPLERRDKLDANEIAMRLWFAQQRDFSNDLAEKRLRAAGSRSDPLARLPERVRWPSRLQLHGPESERWEQFEPPDACKAPPSAGGGGSRIQTPARTKSATHPPISAMLIEQNHINCAVPPASAASFELR